MKFMHTGKLVYWHVLACIGMYWHVLACIGMCIGCDIIDFFVCAGKCRTKWYPGWYSDVQSLIPVYGQELSTVINLNNIHDGPSDDEGDYE